MQGDWKPRQKLNVIQGLLAEKRRQEEELVRLRTRTAAARKRIRELDAALALEATPSSNAYFRTLETNVHDEAAIAGRIGAA